MPILSQQELIDNINADIIDNQSGDISAVHVRRNMISMVDTFFQTIELSGSAPTELWEMGDVDIMGAASGSGLVFDGINWVDFPLITQLSTYATHSELTAATGSFGSMFQPLHANLTSYAGLPYVANRIHYIDSGGTLALTAITEAGRQLIDDTSFSNMRTTLGLGSGNSVVFATVEASSSNPTITLTNGSGSGVINSEHTTNRTWTFPNKSGTIAMTSDVVALTGTYQPLHNNLTQLSNLTLVADRLPYANGSGTLGLTTFTDAARQLLDDSSYNNMRNTLGIGISNDVTFQSITSSHETDPQFRLSNSLETSILTSEHTDARTWILPDKDGVLATLDDIVASGGSSTLDGLLDVNITTPASGHALVYNGSNWVNQVTSGGGGSLATLSDVSLSSPTNGQVLSYSGGVWSNTNVSGVYQPLNTNLTSLSNLFITSNMLPYGSSVNTFSTTTLSPFGRTLIDDGNASVARTTLELGPTNDVIFQTVESSHATTPEVRITKPGAVGRLRSNATGDRLWVFPNKDGIVAMTSDITGSEGSTSLAALTDVDLGTPSSGSSLVYDGAVWRDVASSTTLAGLDDVDIDTPISGSGLMYDGFSWKNFDLQGIINDLEAANPTGFAIFFHNDGRVEYIKSDEDSDASRGAKLVEVCGSSDYFQGNDGLMLVGQCQISEPIVFRPNIAHNILCLADVNMDNGVGLFSNLDNGQRVYIINSGDWIARNTSGVCKGFRVTHANSVLAIVSLGQAGSVDARGSSSSASYAIEVTAGTCQLVGGGTYLCTGTSGANSRSIFRSGGSVLLSPLIYAPYNIQGTVSWSPLYNGTVLQGIGTLGTISANKGLYTTGSNTFSTYDLNQPARSIGSLTDPNADRLMFWDDSAGSVGWLTAGEGITISGTTISVEGAGTGSTVPSFYNILAVESDIINLGKNYRPGPGGDYIFPQLLKRSSLVEYLNGIRQLAPNTNSNILFGHYVWIDPDDDFKAKSVSELTGVDDDEKRRKFAKWFAGVALETSNSGSSDGIMVATILDNFNISTPAYTNLVTAENYPSGTKFPLGTMLSIDLTDEFNNALRVTEDPEECIGRLLTDRRNGNLNYRVSDGTQIGSSFVSVRSNLLWGNNVGGIGDVTPISNLRKIMTCRKGSGYTITHGSMLYLNPGDGCVYPLNITTGIISSLLTAQQKLKTVADFFVGISLGTYASAASGNIVSVLAEGETLMSMPFAPGLPLDVTTPMEPYMPASTPSYFQIVPASGTNVTGGIEYTREICRVSKEVGPSNTTATVFVKSNLMNNKVKPIFPYDA